MKVLSLVRFRPGVAREDAWRAWAEHTRTWDSRDHPDIHRTELTLFSAAAGEGCAFDGMALTHWSSEAAFREAVAWYGLPASAAHVADLARFLSMDDMVTTVIEDAVQIPADAVSRAPGATN